MKTFYRHKGLDLKSQLVFYSPKSIRIAHLHHPFTVVVILPVNRLCDVLVLIFTKSIDLSPCLRVNSSVAVTQ